MDTMISFLRQSNEKTEEEKVNLEFTEDTFEGKDEKTQFFTGLPKFSLLMTVLSLIKSSLPINHNSSLTAFQMLLLTLIKLRFNLPNEFLGEYFNTRF